MDALKKIGELRRTLNEFRARADAIKKSFADVKKIFDTENFVAPAMAADFCENVALWANESAKCHNLWSDIFNEPFPKTFTDMETILTAEEKRLVAQSVFGQAEKFMHLTAEVAALKKSLSAYQRKLKTLLAKKRRGAKTKETIELYAKFINAFDETDYGKKFSAGKELSDFFDDDFIGAGLFGNALILVDTPVEPQTVEPPVDCAKILREKNSLLTADDFAFWKKIFNTQRGNKREITAKRLRKDFEDSYLRNEKAQILIQAAFDNCFSVQMICKGTKFSASDVENAILLLINKGYIQKYSFGEFGDFYGLTKEFFDFLKADGAKEFFKFFSSKVKGLKKNLFKDTDFLEADARFALPRTIFIKLRAIEDKHKNDFDSINFLSQSFQAGFVGKHGQDMIFCCVWDDTAECENFVADAKKILSSEKNFDRLIVAGLNTSHAAKIFDALDEMLKLPKTEQFIFAFDEGAFCRRGTTEKISPEEIWTKLPDKPDPSPDKTKPPKKSKAKTSKNAAVKPPVNDTQAEAKIEPTVDQKKSASPKISIVKPPKISIVKKPPEVKPLELNVAEELKPLYEMFAAKKFYCATAYLRALSLQEETYASTFRQLAYALNDPAAAITYDANKIISLFNESATHDEIFLTAATLRAFFYNHKQFDYQMKTLHGIVKNFVPVLKNAPLADLIFELMNFKDTAKNGADFYADYRVKNRQQTEAKIARLRRDAQTCLERFKNTTDKAYNPRFIEARKILFGDDSEPAYYLEFVAEDALDKESSTNIKNYLIEKLMREGTPLDVANVDNFKLDNIIAEAWEAAGKIIRQKKKNNMLVGELKNNVVKLFKKAIEILCERVNIFEEVASLYSNADAVAYKKVRAKFIELSRSAQKILEHERLVGGEVLLVTLQEIIDKLEGRFEPICHKYFYVNFLRGTEILLDEDYMPILNFNTQDGTSRATAARIVAHARATLPTFEERIENIFEHLGRDFGTAQLIDAYLEELCGESFIAKKKYALQESIYAVKIQADSARKKFFGFLELAQSYGKFDAAPENTKEKILKLIDRCFEFAARTDNFGVFFRVKTFWENQTQADAAKYAVIVEENLERGIKNYQRRTNDSFSPALEKSIAQIRKMIARQNYIVAQALINRLSDGKLLVETEQATGQTHLQRFLTDYETHYYPVRKSGEAFKALIGKSHRFRADTSKGIKGGEILIDNWLPNGFPQNGDVGEEKIERLLNAFGFKVESVKRAGAIKKDALNYKIKLRKPSNGRASNYNHPISAFGSKAEINGFRVTCLFGMYNADGLIERFKQIGNAENTLVLLDYALELPTRRSLARKIKAESGITKIFAVVDRVIMMYLVKNYDELQINKILMSLTMPFAACQPYVFNPNVPMPPEIFIGREKEIAKVLDFDDVNLVYGGRQLGKTALLKMACASLDRNENNDRAIFVDVNKCDCDAAALKICKTLREENFFDETFSDTSDWTELTDAIRKRLASDKPNKIPRFMLALDETDDFIKSCRAVDFKPVLKLIDLQQKFHNGSRFKFVMAGLRDVVRFYREDSLDDNNQIIKLPSLAVKPFDMEDANKLLKEPLRCLGLYFSDDENSDSLAMMILETTNYFPGLIQLYCAKLIEALSKEDYASYNENDSPVYEVSESHVQNVLGEESFNEEIKNKINMTLRLGDDKFYYVIAHFMAWRYHHDDNVAGYSAEDILHTAEDFGLENTLPDVKQIESLLKELCELNILRETDKNKYLFARQRFLYMIGTLEEIELEITNGFGEA